MKNKVTKKQCLEAIEYLFTMGYTKIVLDSYK